MECRKCTSESGVLFEGIIWCRKRESVFWTDIPEGTLYQYSLSRRSVRKIRLGGNLSCLIPARKNRLIAACSHELLLLDPDSGVHESISRITLPGHLRFNDGKCGPGGRIFIGTMAIDQKKEREPGQGGLYSYEDSEGFHLWEPSMTIPNGMDWSLDEDIFYHVETADKIIYGYTYDKETGVISDRRAVLDLSHETGSPDGMTLDLQGRLWIALWGGSKVVCYDPGTGCKQSEIAVPDKNVSCCTFGGQGMDQLFITTARDENGLGGSVYQVQTNAKGRQPYEYSWKGR